MANSRSAGTSALIIGLIIVVLFAFLIPAIFVAQETPTELSTNQAQGEIIILTGTLQASLNDVSDGSASDIDVTILDTKTGQSENIANLDENQSETVTISGESITVTNIEKASNTEAVIKYEYPLYYSWPEGIKFIVENIVLFMLVFSVLLILAMVLLAMDLSGDSS